MRTKTKLILGLPLTVALCASLVAGGTLALFSSESKVNIAITSGKVDVTASVTNLFTGSNTDSIDAISDWTEGTKDGSTFTGNFTSSGTATYSVDGGAGKLTLDKISPGDAVKLTLSIKNESDIRIKYQIRMLAEDDYVATPAPSGETAFSSALEVKIGEEASKTGLVYAFAPWSDAIETDDEIQPIDISIRLPSDASEYENNHCSIALTVYAIQSNARATSYCQEVGKHLYGEDSCLYCGEANPFKNHHTDGSTYTITGVDDDRKELYIPSEIDGKTVKLNASAFSGKTTLEHVTIEEGVTEIPASCFENCTNLKEFDLPKSVTTVGGSAFWGCPFESLDLSNLTSIGQYGFTNSGLKEVNLGASLKTLGSYVFNGCSKLERVTFAEESKLTSIPYSAFNGCSALTDIELPKTVTSLGEYAFMACSALQTINLDNITSIGVSAFGTVKGQGCTSLQSVSLPKVTTIGERAFENCTALQTVSLAEDTSNAALTIGTSAFTGCSALSDLTFGTTNIKLKSVSDTNKYENTFNDCVNLHTIHFAGTTTEWTALKKGFVHWLYDTTKNHEIAYTVHCTDGTVNEDGTVTPKE